MAQTNDTSIAALTKRIERRINFLMSKLKDIAHTLNRNKISGHDQDILLRKAVKIVLELEPYKEDILKFNPLFKVFFDITKDPSVKYVGNIGKIPMEPK